MAACCSAAGRQASQPASRQDVRDENPYSEEDEAQVMERLRETGYVA